MVCQPGEVVPVFGYGGIERVVGWWTKELVKQGHHVILYAREGSTVGSEVVGWKHSEKQEQEFANMAYLDLGKKDVDIVVDNTHQKWLGRFPIKNYIAMLHMEYCPVQKQVVGCSRNNAWLNDSDVYVHLGVDLDEYRLETDKDDYLLYLGAIAPHKQVHVAVMVARKLGIPIKVAGPRREGFEVYFDTLISDLTDEEYVGAVGGEEKQELLGKAKALLWPINWEEPGGTIFFESVACGTPVIAYRRGCAPELVEDGITGYLVGNPYEMSEAVKKLDKIDPQTVRNRVAEKWNMELTIERQLQIYQTVIDGERW